jgi:large subunit ribosomal protein L14e
MFEVGRVCIKTAGREAGRYCVVVKKMDEKFVMVTGPMTKVKRRRCNIHHLEPVLEKVKIKADASDDEVLRAFDSEGLLSKFSIKVPRKTEHKPEIVKKEPERKEEHKTETKKEPPKPKDAPKEKKPETKKEAKVEHKPEKKEAKPAKKEAKAKKVSAGKKAKSGKKK